MGLQEPTGTPVFAFTSTAQVWSINSVSAGLGAAPPGHVC